MIKKSKGRSKSNLEAALKKFTVQQRKLAENTKRPPLKRQANVNRGLKSVLPFENGDDILLIGEANFSFALALARLFYNPALASKDEPLATIPPVTGTLSDIDEEFLPDIHKEGVLVNIVATTLDSQEVTFRKYPDAADNVAQLQQLGILVHFDTDGTADLSDFGMYDKIVFNSPHVGLGIKDQKQNIRENQLLLCRFFQASLRHCRHPNGQIIVTVKNGEPYDSWQIKAIAHQVGLACKRSFAFDPSIYTGYAHRRTLGFQEGISKDGNEEVQRKGARTFVFWRKKNEEEQRKGDKNKRRRNASSENQSDSE